MDRPTDTSRTPAPVARYALAVEGMTCQHCVARVEEAIRAVAGVTDADVDLAGGSAQVSGGQPHAVIAALEKVGYEARPRAASAPSCEATPAERPSTSTSVAAMDDAYRIDIDDMTCASCVARVEKAILAVPGVSTAAVNLVEGAAYVQGGVAKDVAEAIIDQGYPARPAAAARPGGEVRLRFATALTAEQRQQVEQRLQTVAAGSEVRWAGDNQARLTLRAHAADYLLILRQAGFDPVLEEIAPDPYLAQEQQARYAIRQSLLRALAAGLLGSALMGAMMTGLLPHVEAGSALSDLSGRGFWLAMAALTLLTMIYSGRDYYVGAWKQLKHVRANMDTLVAVGTAAAWLASLLLILAPDFVPAAQRHLYLETSVLILAFLQFGHALEVRAKARTSRAIGALVALAPKSARLVRNGQEVTMPAALLQPGDVFRVRPGDAVAGDGVVVQGSSSIDESMLSGEPLAVAKTSGDEVTGGTINQSGSLLVRVSRAGADSTLAGIIQAVKQAQMSKPPIGRLVDRIAAVFVPLVMLIALLSFGAWMAWGPQPALPFALTTAIAVLVIACPCALGLATPIAIMVGMGRAARFGILIRNGDALQSAADISHLIVDKTGTLTEGKPRITAIYPADGVSEEQLLRWAASLEQPSGHPLAQAVLASAQARAIAPLPVTDFHAEGGQGVRARIESRQFFLGRQEWLQELGIGCSAEQSHRADALARDGKTPIWLADRQQVLGVLGLNDPVRHDTPAAIEALHRAGIQVVMCTGDHPDTANTVASQLNIDTVHSRVLPQRKAEIVAELQARGHTVGMVGDGVNDAPALTQAHVGFAIGAGTDVAIESADVTLASDSLTSVAGAITLSRATLRNIRQNLFGAFIYNVIGIPLAAGALYPFTGWLLNPVFASLAMALSSVTVVTNANRLRFFQPMELSTDE